MPVMGRIVQRFVEFFPLFAEAFFDALAQTLEQALTLRGTQEARKSVEDHQQRGHFLARRQRRVGFGHLRHASLCGFGLIVFEQIRRQHLAITPRCGQLTDRRRCVFQLLDTRQAAQRPQQTAQASHRGAQIVQRLRVGTRGEARLTGQQSYFQAQDMSHQAVNQRRHHLLPDSKSLSTESAMSQPQPTCAKSAA